MSTHKTPKLILCLLFIPARIHHTLRLLDRNWLPVMHLDLDSETPELLRIKHPVEPHMHITPNRLTLLHHAQPPTPVPAIATFALCVFRVIHSSTSTRLNITRPPIFTKGNSPLLHRRYTLIREHPKHSISIATFTSTSSPASVHFNRLTSLLSHDISKLPPPATVYRTKFLDKA